MYCPHLIVSLQHDFLSCLLQQQWTRKHWNLWHTASGNSPCCSNFHSKKYTSGSRVPAYYMATSYPHTMCCTRSVHDTWWKTSLIIWGRKECCQHETIPFIQHERGASRHETLTAISWFWSWILSHFAIRVSRKIRSTLQTKRTTRMAQHVWVFLHG